MPAVNDRMIHYDAGVTIPTARLAMVRRPSVLFQHLYQVVAHGILPLQVVSIVAVSKQTIHSGAGEEISPQEDWEKVIREVS